MPLNAHYVVVTVALGTFWAPSMALLSATADALPILLAAMACFAVLRRTGVRGRRLSAS